MVDVVFRDVDEATLRKLLELLGGAPYEIEGRTPQWTTELALQILRTATRRASTIARALVDHDGEITVDQAHTVIADVHPAHAVASLNASWKKCCARIAGRPMARRSLHNRLSNHSNTATRTPAPPDGYPATGWSPIRSSPSVRPWPNWVAD